METLTVDVILFFFSTYMRLMLENWAANNG